MPYIPLSCDAVDFALRPFLSHSCGSADFDITGVNEEYSWILPYSTKIRLKGPDSSASEIMCFNCGGSHLHSQVNDGSFEWVEELSVDGTKITSASNDSQYEPLADITSYGTHLRHIAPEAPIYPGGVESLPSGIHSRDSYRWNDGNHPDCSNKHPWKGSALIDIRNNLNPGDIVETDASINDGWNTLGLFDQKLDIVDGTFPLCDSSLVIPWGAFFIADDRRSVPYGYMTSASCIFIVPYGEPGACDCGKSIKFYGIEQNNISSTFSFQYGEPGACDKSQLVPWGPIDLFPFCNLMYHPPIGEVMFNMSFMPMNLVGICMNVAFDVEGYNSDHRCPHVHTRSGSRDPYIHGAPIQRYDLKYGISKEVYYMMNTVFVKTALTQEFIEILAVTATIDKQSWLWQFNLVVGSRASLDKVKPVVQSDEIIFIDVEININGWKFACRVESWSENRSFGKDTWNITGRSPSMELGNPQNPVSSFTYLDQGGGLAGAQIMDEVLTGTMLGRADLGWTLDWSFYNAKITDMYGFDPSSAEDWGIPDGAYSWSDKTQIEAIKQLTDSIGAYIQTDNDCLTSKTLIVKPKFHVPPWHWSFTSRIPQNVYKDDVLPGELYHIDHVIPDGVFREVGRSFVSLPTYNAVFVMGQSSVPAEAPNVDPGVVLVDVFKTGNGPGYRTYAPNITDPWITTVLSAMEAGRMVICNTGEWVHHFINLFSLAHTPAIPNEGAVKLVLPGEYVQCTEKGVNWFGQVESTSISASMVSGAACSVTQTVEIHEYIGTKSVEV